MAELNQVRPSWDEYFITLARDISTRSTCFRRKVGAILIDNDKRILSSGYNGKPAGLPNCNDHVDIPEGSLIQQYPHACSGAFAPSGSHPTSCEAVHAEQNALMYCADVRLIHTCYITRSPCLTCVNQLMGTACKRIVFDTLSSNPDAERRWKSLGREWVHYGVS